MHPRLLIAAAAFVTSAGCAAADSYACHSLNETDFAVTANFDLRYSSGAFAVMSADLQIEGDIGYSTEAEHPSNRAFVTGVEVGTGAIKFDFHQTLDGYDGDVATLHVVTLSEGVHDLTAGVLQVSGGGLWPIECNITYEHPLDH